MSARLQTAAFAALSLLLGGRALAQVAWQSMPVLEGRRDHAMAYDPVRGRVVVFGGVRDTHTHTTWEWDGSAWRGFASPTAPEARVAHAMAFDPVRGRVLLFGGTAAAATVVLGDTWEWDGAAWHRLAPATSPSPRSDHALALDPVRGRLLLFGGVVASGSVSDETWSWTGSTWQRETPAQAPPGRVRHAMVTMLGGVLMAGGHDGVGPTGDSWLWDGAAWRAVASFGPRWGHAMAGDPTSRRVYLFGGATIAGVVLGDVHAFDGSTWTQVAAGPGPGARVDSAMVFAPGLGPWVMFAGRSTARVEGDTWAFDGSTWSRVAPAQCPQATNAHVLVSCAALGGVLCVGGIGNDGAYLWDGSRWREVAAPAHGMFAHAAAEDTARGRVVVLDGLGGSAGETWEFDGTAWTVAPVNDPALRRLTSALAYDAVRQRVVLFGGFFQNSLDDTWEWDGATWVQRMPATRPPARAGHALAFDQRRGRVVLFGGNRTVGGPLGDTWEWDGSNWQLRTHQNQPTPRSGHAMAYDAARGRTVLFGGADVGQFHDDVWEWDGSDWTRRVLALGPRPRNSARLAYDAARRRMVLFGGDAAFDVVTTSVADTWEYGPTVPAAFAAFGSGCGAGGEPLLAGASGPWVGQPFPLRLTNLQPTALAAMVLGGSRQTWNGVALPLPLASIGMAGCSLRASAELFVPLLPSGGAATLTLPVPALPHLVGSEFFVQGFATDPGANALGVAASAGGAARVGGM